MKAKWGTFEFVPDAHSLTNYCTEFYVISWYEEILGRHLQRTCMCTAGSFERTEDKMGLALLNLKLEA